MPGNASPIFSRVADIQRSGVLTAAANDYNGASANNQSVFRADATNGGFIQRLRFKALGTNIATVARVYIGNGFEATQYTSAPAAPTGTPSSSGGTILTGNYYAKIVAIMADGSFSAVGTESSAVAVTGPTGSIAWSWTAVDGAASYRIYIGVATGAQTMYYTSATNSYSQTTMHTVGSVDGSPTLHNLTLYGEISLPATTASATAATVDIDYPLNFALPPGYQIFVGLGTAVSAGWQVTSIAGAY